MFFVEPGSPFMRRCLENLVEIIELEYLRRSPVVGEFVTALNQKVICSTGPMLFTFSIIEEIYHMVKNGTNPNMKYVGYDFKLFNATMKMIRIRDTPHHYGKIVFNRDSKESLLNEYSILQNARKANGRKWMDKI